MAKRGRPKKERVALDTGTPEQQLKRISLVGKKGDPALAEYPLGVLLARGIIDRDQHQAGCIYAWQYGKAVGKTVELGVGEIVGQEMTEEDSERVRARFLETKRRLIQAGRRAADAVENVAVYRRLPRWLFTTRPRPSDARDRAALIDGLNELVSALIGRKAA